MLLDPVDIVVLNWNEREETLRCVDQLLHIGYPQYRIVIADNGSTDGSVQAFVRFGAMRGIPVRRIDKGAVKESERPASNALRASGCREIVVIENGANLGFAGGVNSGLLLCRTERLSKYALLLNNDVRVSSGFLTSLVRIAERDSEVGIVGGKILYEPREGLHEGCDNLIWYAGGRINLLKGCGYVCFGNGRLDDGTWDREGPTSFVTGAMMLIKIDVLDTVGLLDSRFFFGSEDVDYCLRVRKMGFRIYYSPACRIWHKSTAFTYDEGALSRIAYGYTGKLLLWLKYFPAYLMWPLLVWHVIYGETIGPYRLSLLARRHGAAIPPSRFREVFRRSLARALTIARSERSSGDA